MSLLKPDILLSTLGTKVSKQTDCHIYMAFSNICRVYINIPRMASNIIRQIARQTLKISLNLFNFSNEVSRLTECQTYNKYKGIFEPRVQTSRKVYTKFCSIQYKGNKKYYEFKLNVYRQAGHKQTNRPGPRDDSTKGGSPKETFTLISHDRQ